MDPGIRDTYLGDAAKPDLIRSVELDVFERELKRYCRGEVEGRSFLVAGHRGAGKTTLVRHAVFSFEGDERELDKLIRRREKANTWGESSNGSKSRDDGIRHRLNRLCDAQADERFLSQLREAKQLSTSKLDDLPGLRRKVRRPLLVELQGPSIFPENSEWDDHQVGRIAISQLIRSLYQSLAERMTADYREYATVDGRDAQFVEFAAQLRLLRHQPLTARQLRPYWWHLTEFRHGVLFGSIDVPHKDQALRELVALDVAGQAFAAVQKFDKSNGSAGNGHNTTITSGAEQEEVPSNGGGESRWRDWAKPVLSVLAAGVLGSGTLTIPGVHVMTAFAVGALVLLIASLISLYYNYRLESDAQKQISIPLPDDEYATLERMFRELLKHIKEIHLAPVFVIDELDKVRDLPTRIGPLVRSLKKLCAENAFFCFLTDRSYFERVSNIDRGTPYPVEYTYFSHRLFVLYDPNEGRKFVERRVDGENRKLKSYFVVHRSLGVPIDIKRWLERLDEFDRLVYAPAAGRKDIGEKRELAPVVWSDIITQISIDAELDVKQGLLGGQGRFVRDALFYPTRCRQRNQAEIDLTNENSQFENYLRECTETDDMRGGPRHAVDEVIRILERMAGELRKEFAAKADWRQVSYCRELAKEIDDACDTMHHSDRVQITLGIDQIVKQLGDRKTEPLKEIRSRLGSLKQRLAATDPLPQSVVQTLRRRVRALCEGLCLGLSDDACFVERVKREFDKNEDGQSQALKQNEYAARLFAKVKLSYGEPDRHDAEDRDSLWTLDRFFDALAELNKRSALTHVGAIEAKTDDPAWRAQLEDLRERARKSSPLVKVGEHRYQWQFYESGAPVVEPMPARKDPVLQELKAAADLVLKVTGGALELDVFDPVWLTNSANRWGVVRLLLMDLLRSVTEDEYADVRGQQREITRIYLTALRDADHALMFMLVAAKLICRADGPEISQGQAVRVLIDVLSLNDGRSLETHTSMLRSLLRHCGEINLRGKGIIPTRGNCRLGKHGFDRWSQKTLGLLDSVPDQPKSGKDIADAAWRHLEARLLSRARGEDFSPSWLVDPEKSAELRVSYAQYALAFCRSVVAYSGPASVFPADMNDVSATTWTRCILRVLLDNQSERNEDIRPYWLVWAALCELGLTGGRVDDDLLKFYVDRARQSARDSNGEDRSANDATWARYFIPDDSDVRGFQIGATLVIHADDGGQSSRQSDVVDWPPTRTHAILSMCLSDAESLLRKFGPGADADQRVVLPKLNHIVFEWSDDQDVRMAALQSGIGQIASAAASDVCWAYFPRNDQRDKSGEPSFDAIRLEHARSFDEIINELLEKCPGCPGPSEPLDQADHSTPDDDPENAALVV
ncbi:MAG: hypothetical protein H6819_04065 [Phycisphaerales bacterium]|nr:hypothetical protein [Phycisphaerales bacterium]MCB9856374.1 hypothetical protein [Phycisphaerales bacterium]MCB9864046.1 hypothetical protein [Phycisphaerales bacterium]